MTAANKKLTNLNEVSEVAEQLLSEALSVPLATHLGAARALTDDLVRRRVAVAKGLLDAGRLDEAKAQIQAARTIKGAKIEDTKLLATAIANRIIELTASDVRKLIDSEDFTTAEAKIRAVLKEPEATKQEPASTLLETISKERAKVANKKLARIVAEAQAEFDAVRISEAQDLLNQAKGLAHATELTEFDKLQVQVKAAIREEQREKEMRELIAARKRKEEAAPLINQKKVAQQGGSWEAFNRECGLTASSSNQVRAEALFAQNWQGKTVDWEGTVVLFGGYSIMCKMPRSTSIVSDVSYIVPATMRDRVLSISKGDKIRIQGKIESQGGAITNHTIKSDK
ncbi:MAG: hypothetical protein ABL962_20635 [Fimbriimonadaceae bacterium]